MDIYKGEDKTINLTVSSDGVILDLSTVVDVVVIVYYKQTGAILNKYKKIPATGYDSFTVVSAPAGTAKVLLQRATTLNAPDGPIVMDVKLQFTDASFQAGLFDAVSKGILLGQIVDTVTKGEL